MDLLRDVREVALQAAFEGGRILSSFVTRNSEIRAKTPFEMVTDADIAAENSIISYIQRHYPEHTIRSEERGHLAGDPDDVWIIDPLDGTLKYILGEPYYAVSIAFAHKGIVEIGVVRNPFTRETYFAQRNMGAFKDEIKLEVTASSNLNESFVCCDWGGSRPMQQEGLCYLSELLPPVSRGVGINFSPALDLCNLARGNIAAMISNGTTPEDHAAGALIVVEAGGHITNFGRPTWSHQHHGIVAACSPMIHDRVSQIVGGCRS